MAREGFYRAGVVIWLMIRQPLQRNLIMAAAVQYLVQARLLSCKTTGLPYKALQTAKIRSQGFTALARVRRLLPVT